MLDEVRKGGRVHRRPAVENLLREGFTLIELMVVMVIIGILLVFILNASWNAVRSAQEKATQGLISKLDAALTDRVDAILQSQVVDTTFVQNSIAHSYDGSLPSTLSMSERAFVLAQIELFAREVPDVFYVQAEGTGYPLNFAANPYPLEVGNPNYVVDAPPTDAKFVLPLGTGWLPATSGGTTYNYFNPGEGIYGASYQMAAGLYKSLGYQTTGFDGVDNDGDGRIDEWDEGVNASNEETVRGNLGRHQHKTARSEVLYALLVESQGPFGSIFNREDFTDQEVKDTDGDGLPEFVDAWGEPLQFYRWPLLFTSPLQRGLKFQSSGDQVAYAAPYGGMIEQREMIPLDPNQQLLAPAWWSPLYNDPYNNGGTPPFFPSGFAGNPGAGWSSAVAFYENYFHLLHEPLNYPSGSSPPIGLFWDRGAPGGPFRARRAYSSKFLIVSSGPDKELGLFHYDDAALQADLTAAASNSAVSAAYPLQGIESLAVPLHIDDIIPLLAGGAAVGDLLRQKSAELQALGQDDINSHNVPAGAIGGSTP